MKRADRNLALKAKRMSARGLMPHAIARRLKLSGTNAATGIANKGLMIERAEGHRLTDREILLMKTLARVEARAVELGQVFVRVNEIDFAAGQRSGWCGAVANKRLRRYDVREDEPSRLNFLIITDSRNIWLTPAGWAFVWATGLILKNWKVPV